MNGYVGYESVLGFIDFMGCVYKKVLNFVFVLSGRVFDCDSINFRHGGQILIQESM